MIRFRVLGSLDLRDSEGQEVLSVLAQPRRTAVLAYLALARPRGPHRRDTLLALFWPEQDTEHARNALNQAVHFLRRSLGTDALLSRNGDELGLEWNGFWCDAVAFEDALQAGRPARAIELYRGELLEGFHVADAPEFERWLESERERLSGRYAQAVTALAEACQAARDLEGALGHWRRLAAHDPYSSRVALGLMRALAAAGDPAGAIRYARLHERLLREELDIAPDPELAALVRQLHSAAGDQQQRPSAGTAGPAPVPEASGGMEASPGAAGESIAPPTGPEPAPGAALDRSGRRWRARRRHAAVVAAGLVALGMTGLGAFLRSGTREPAVPPIRFIAVLPLENLSGDPAQDWFADQMHDLLVTELARYPELSVTSRTSVIRYKGTTQSLPEIASELKVEGVVLGSVLRDGGRVRLNARLAHGPSDRHLWAESYERDLRDVFVLQGELAGAIAREVRLAAAPMGRRRATATGPADSLPSELHLRELYLRGRHAELSRSLVGVQTAREAYRRAIELDSTFALGYAGLAGVYGFLADYNFAPVEPALDSARMMARRAVALDSTLPETRTALAVTLADAGDFAAAEREFRRAIELGPSNARAHYWYSMLLIVLGRGEEALRAADRSAQLDPFAPRGVVAMQRYARYLITGEYPHLKLPVTERRPILKLEPGEPWARAREAAELAQAGRCSEAREEIARAQQLVQPGNAALLPHVGAVYLWCGERGHARALVEEMKRRPNAHDHGFSIAWLHTHFGETDSAFVWLDRHRWTMSDLSALRGAWVLHPLRSDPRYPRLLQRLGIH